ncbi:hypothetical protein RYZ27_09045 [Hyphomonas sp. FCG-A18]|uniref:hypothetical protein n=1 Tax=Hyphomonas sp. FCG-A18 TaxID=3080019 RepID=UPI002B2DAFB5|nr:hypothetical protein RYZ27_09045 [Hyphomonas sp. FCG-A18]
MTAPIPQPSACAAGLASADHSTGSKPYPTRDLRALTIEDRQALAAEAGRLARLGVSPADIRAQLGIRVGTYARWAKLYGFRQGDLHPQAHRAGAPLTTPAGPGGYCRSGQLYLNQPVPEDDPRRVSGPDHPSWRGGRAAAREKYQTLRDDRRNAFMRKVAQMPDGDILSTVRDLLDKDELTEADRWLSAWRAARRREKTLGDLEKAMTRQIARQPITYDENGLSICTDPKIKAMSDEELDAYLEALMPKPQSSNG